MNRGKLLIALFVTGALAVGLGSTVLPASAQDYSVTVELPTGATRIVVLPTCASDLGKVVSCIPLSATQSTEAQTQSTQSSSSTQSSQSTSSSTSSTSSTSTQATGSVGTTGTTDTTATQPGDDEPSGGAAPGKRPSSGDKKSKSDKKKRSKKNTKKESKAQDEASSKDSDSASGTADASTTPDGQASTQADGQPSLSNPTVTLADPGPAAIGVPNFVIDRFKIPPFLLPIYKAAEAQYNIPWQVLAAVNEIETNYGQNLNVSSAGAVGWMQFLPSTWKTYGTDANGDGRRDPYNPVDAIFSAARYMKAAGGETDIRKGLFAYNPANWYVDSVLLRAKVIGGLPADLIGSLTQIVEGRFPVAARARYADQLTEREATRRVARSQNASIPVTTQADRQSIDIFSRAGAPVIAVNDGEILKVGSDARRGRYVILKDYAGNRYTYSKLGSVVTSYPAPKEKPVSQSQVRDELGLPKDPKPTAPASAGAQPGGKAAAASKSGTARATRAPASAKRSAATPTRAAPSVQVTKERLFANPTRPSAYGNGGQDQVAATTGKRDFETYGAYFAKVFGLGRDDVTFKALKPGAQVVAGTVLGRVGTPETGKAPYATFGIRPTGKGAPTIDPKPILDGWKLLESTAIYRAAGRNPFLDQKSISVGQMLLMTKEQLGRSVLADPRISNYECGRQDIQANLIDKRVLIVMKYLAGSGLKPTVSALKCGHSKLVAGGGRVSDHWYGRAVDIAAVNGIPILGNQQDGGITDITIRKLLELQGAMRPSQIISLRTYQGFDNTLSLSDHDDHIHVGFSAVAGQGAPGADTVLKPGQWRKLIDRLGQIDNPSVPIRPSRYALPNDPTGRKSGD